MTAGRRLDKGRDRKKTLRGESDCPMIRAIKFFFKRVLPILLVLFVAYQVWILAHVLWWRNHNPGMTAFMSERLEILQKKDPEFQLRHKWVSYAKISPNLKRALVASEDAKFLDHDGFDWEGMQDAWERNIKKGRIVAGGSTISQQLAKNLFLTPGKTPWRKLEEAAINVMLETVMEKRRIFEIYLNVIEWGNGVYGAEAAAQRYFGVSAAQLSWDQAAWLASIVPNPRYFEKHRRDRKVLRKAAIIRRRMRYADFP